jgi:hypothetical protein
MTLQFGHADTDPRTLPASTAPRNVTVCASSVHSDIAIGGSVPEVSWASLTRGSTLWLVDAPCRRRTSSLAAIVGVDAGALV